jgi:hypothetical protein
VNRIGRRVITCMLLIAAPALGVVKADRWQGLAASLAAGLSRHHRTSKCKPARDYC